LGGDPKQKMLRYSDWMRALFSRKCVWAEQRKWSGFFAEDNRAEAWKCLSCLVADGTPSGALQSCAERIYSYSHFPGGTMNCSLERVMENVSWGNASKNSHLLPSAKVLSAVPGCEQTCFFIAAIAEHLPLFGHNPADPPVFFFSFLFCCVFVFFWFIAEGNID